MLSIQYEDMQEIKKDIPELVSYSQLGIEQPA